MVRLSPSASLGALRPKLVPLLSSSTVMLVLATSGASLTGVTVRLTVTGAEGAPLASLMV
ncbi:hypothetical protein D3C78_1404220 [compost metagenome]